MANSIKVRALYDVLQSGQPVKFTQILKSMNMSNGAVMCLISALRNDFGADIETVRDGRKVSHYVLKNGLAVVDSLNSVSTKQKAVSKTVKAPKPAKAPRVAKSVVKKTVSPSKKKNVADDDGSVSVLDADLEISEVSDAELADIKTQLGIA